MLAVFLTQAAFAQEFSVQGVLRDPSGRTLADGAHELTFTLYDTETGGNQLWTETQGSVSLSNGVFSAILGSSSSLSGLAFDQTYWLGISVDGQPEISTRMEITTTPYSMAVRGSTNIVPSTGNVGIGTVTPAVPLNFASDTGDKISLWGEDPDNHYGFGVQSTLLQIHTANNNDAVAFGYGGSNNFTETARITGSGRLGIGTAYPLSPLHVVGESYFVGRLRLMRTAGPNYVDFYNGENLYFRSIDTDDSGSDLRMTISTAGNVGIGTDTPATALEVNGSIQLTAGSGGAIYFQDGTSLSSANLGGTASSVSADADVPVSSTSGSILLKTAGADRMTVGNDGNVGIGTSAPRAKLSVEDANGGYVDLNPMDGNIELASGNDTWSFIDFKGNSNLSEDYMGRFQYIDDYGFSFIGGKVGIGNSSPADMLHVAGGTYLEDRLRLMRTTGPNYIDFFNGDDLFLRSISTDDTDGNVRMAITTAGNVGIGTASPAVPLNFAGSVGNKISFYGEDTANHYGIGVQNSLLQVYAAGSVDNIAFGYGGSNNFSELMRITGSGRVGIGTTSPGTTLELYSSAPYIRFNDSEGGSDWDLGNYGNNRFILLENGSERISFQEGGYVGINNTAPDGLLSLDAMGDGSVLNIHSSHSSNGKIFEVTQTGSDGLVSVRTGAGDTITQLSGYSGTPSYFFSKVGIGTNSPTHDLTIINSGGASLKMGTALTTTWDVLTNNAGYYLYYAGNHLYQTYTDGNAWMAGGLSQYSDRSLKEDIQTVDNALDKVIRLRGVTYYWKKDLPDGRQMDTRKHYGFIAQEVENVLPDIISEGPDGKKTIVYSEISSVLVEAVKEQQGIIQSLQEENNQIMEENRANQDKLESLERKLAQFEQMLKNLSQDGSANGNHPSENTK